MGRHADGTPDHQRHHLGNLERHHLPGSPPGRHFRLARLARNRGPVLPQRSPKSTVVTQTFIALRSDADALAALCYSMNGYLITAVDDEGVTFSNLFVKDVTCTKPLKKMGETLTGTTGPVYHMMATWTFIAPLPENT